MNAEKQSALKKIEKSAAKFFDLSDAIWENPELSLTALALLHTPPISKPGLSHRLKRIEKFANEALKKR